MYIKYYISPSGLNDAVVKSLAKWLVGTGLHLDSTSYLDNRCVLNILHKTLIHLSFPGVVFLFKDE